MFERLGFLSRRLCVCTFIYLFAAGAAADRTVVHTNASTDYQDQAYGMKSLGNEVAQAAAEFEKHHGVIGPFVAAYLRKRSDLPTLRASTRSLARIPFLSRCAAREEGLAAVWSGFLMCASLAYLALAAAWGGPDRTRSILFALTGVSAVLFWVGITASAMMILTSVDDFFGAAPVIEHEVRSVFSVIVGLFATGHWIFAGFIVVFSILTPLAKVVLTFAAALTASSSSNSGISKFLNAIGKWSMADVFVAAVLLACFTIKSGGNTRVIPFRGLYYFAAYCLMSMVTTSLLHRLDFGEKGVLFDSEGQIRVPALGELAGVLLFFSAVYGLKR